MKFYLNHTEQKGRHYICNSNIYEDEILLIEQPFLIIKVSDFQNTDKLINILLNNKNILNLLYDLSPDNGFIINFNSIFVKELIIKNLDILIKKISLNGFYFNKTDIALFYSGTFFNHSCKPNVIYKEINNKMHFVALQNIKVGQELCISYISKLNIPYHLRSFELNNWNFMCDCKLCSLEKFLILNKDKNIFNKLKFLFLYKLKYL